MLHLFDNGARVEMIGADETGGYDASEYSVHLYDESGRETVSWTGDEWVEDPSVVAAIVNAICQLA